MGSWLAIASKMDDFTCMDVEGLAAATTNNPETNNRFLRRMAQKAAKVGRVGAAAATAVPHRTRGEQSTDLYPVVDVTMPLDPKAGLVVLRALDEALSRLEGVCRELPVTEAEQRSLLADGYTHMMRVFHLERIKRRYGYTKQDHKQQPLAMGGEVPSYWANVKDQSIWRRKLLSMAGLRNLVIYGPIIYTQLREKLFVGDINAYNGDEGLHLMRKVTGNLVDLDTTVLRCTDRATLDAINASNKHKRLPTYSSCEIFAASAQAEEIAVQCALPLLDSFSSMLRLSDAEKRSRKIDPSEITRPVVVASSNTERGHAPVWHYVNAGQNSFHVNVPSMDDVNGALLKAPYHCLKHWFAIHALFQGDELDKRIDDFFEDCVADSCFNMKWKAIEEYGYKMAHEGTIVDVLQRAQMANQAVFTATFFDADNETHDAEAEEMYRICVAGCLFGRDRHGVVREITREDVTRWVRDPSIAL